MNFSISEILVILLIALLVIKPEQLPDVAFSLGRFAQYIRKTFGKIKTDMNTLLEVDSAKPTAANEKHIHNNPSNALNE